MIRSHRHNLSVWIILISVSLIAAREAFAGGTPLTTRRIVAGMTNPVFVTAPPGDTNRLFIVEQRNSGGVASRGDIRIFNLNTGTVNATPFLSVTGLALGNDLGLLGMAFAPDYATSGRFYLNYTAAGGGGVGTTRIARGTVSANPDVANASLETILSYVQPATNHNGGWLDFGADGYLYIASGDGGNQYDPNNNGQDIIDQRLGKILRLDVSTPTGYAIPPTNPFAGPTAGDDEIWIYGLRNPWRCSFDRETGDLWTADVGQDFWEEIHFQAAGSAGGENYGWRCMEGTHCTGLTGCTCNDPGLTLPIYEYDHSVGCSITGGYVYRGCAIPDLRGTYFYADYCSGRIWSLRYNGAAVTDVEERTTELRPNVGLISNPDSFGEDGAGELYIIDLSGGEVFKIEAAAAPAPMVESVSSIGLHKTGPGTTQEFPVNLNITTSAASRTSESRDSGLRTFEVQFTEDVSSASLSVTGPGGPAGGGPLTLGPGTHGPMSRGRIDLGAALPNQTAYSIAISGSADPCGPFSAELCAAALVGDFNSDGIVNALDKAQLSGFIFQPISQLNARYDLQTNGGDSGTIDVGDLGAWSGFFGGNVQGNPCP